MIASREGCGCRESELSLSLSISDIDPFNGCPRMFLENSLSGLFYLGANDNVVSQRPKSTGIPNNELSDTRSLSYFFLSLSLEGRMEPNRIEARGFYNYQHSYYSLFLSELLATALGVRRMFPRDIRNEKQRKKKKKRIETSNELKIGCLLLLSLYLTWNWLILVANLVCSLSDQLVQRHRENW